MSQPEAQTSWTLRDGMPLSGDATLDALHARVLTETPIPADAIVWLQGNGYDRGPKALDLFRAGFAPRTIITGNRVRSPITVDHLAQWLRDRDVPASALLLDATAMHTRDQAVHVLAIAQERNWFTLLLIASPHHQLRAFLTFVKRAEEIGWAGRITNQPVATPWGAMPSGRNQVACELLHEECAKLDRYRAHVVSVATGLTYIDRADTAQKL